MGKKLTMNDVKRRLKNINPHVKLLERQYENAKTKMLCRCKKDGYEWLSDWSHLSQGRGCPQCAGNVKMTYEKVKNYVETNSNCKLISEEYINNESKLTFQCKCGRKFEKTLNDFRRNNKNCPQCSASKRGKMKRTNKQDIERLITSKGFEFLDLKYVNGKSVIMIEDKEGYKFKVGFADFKNDKTPKRFSLRNDYLDENIKNLVSSARGYSLKRIEVNESQHPVIFIECDKRHEYKTTAFDFNQGKRCYKCYRLNNFGENHPNYNPNLTDEEREKGRNLYKHKLKEWRKNVLARDFHTCKCCFKKGGVLHAHHLNGYHWCKEERYDVDNGATLCESCHREFHHIYGFKNNTKEQFKEFNLLQHA